MTALLPASDTRPDYLSFLLPDDFVSHYAEAPVQWGFPCGGGNYLGEIVYYRSYSRTKEDGTKERWYETCQRVIEGMYSIQLDHVANRRMPWNPDQGTRSATEAFDRLFNMKWTPPGRGLFAMGSPLVNRLKNSAPLYNCAVCDFVPDDAEKYIDAAAWLMEASAFGIGVGFVAHPTTEHMIYAPTSSRVVTQQEVIDATGEADGIDSREGWCYSLRLLLRAFLVPDMPLPDFTDVYPLIRPRGAPLKTFGGTASGPESLVLLHDKISTLLSSRVGTFVDSRVTTDLANMIGKCIVAGAKRRSAELALGYADDKTFADLKNASLPENEYRLAGDWPFGWMSNNSVIADLGMDYSHHVQRTVTNGEPGYVYLDLARRYGRMVDGEKIGPDGLPDDDEIVGVNPCSEIFLADRELCCLSTVHLNRAESLEDFLRTVKFAYLYAKTVLLMPTNWPLTNTVMLRNQRIGCSVTGVAEFVDRHGWAELRRWLDAGYKEIRRWDKIYSDWLCVRRSIRSTTIKPEGSTSLLSGATPGDHWAEGRAYIRRIEVQALDPLVEVCRRAGYRVEPKIGHEDTTVVIEFPVLHDVTRTTRDVSIYEKMALAAETQRWWADNGVSVTVSFDPKREGEDVERVLKIYEGQLKSVSFLPLDDIEELARVYPQLPFDPQPVESIVRRQREVRPIDWNVLYDGEGSSDAMDSKFCTTDVCSL